MKKAIGLLSIVGLTVGVVTLVVLFWPPTRTRSAFAEFPPEQSRFIDFEVRKEVLETMTRREQVDQMRDWLLFTAVADAGLSAAEINQSLFDLPAIRHGYLKPTSNFEYGAARSCYLGSGQVLAMVPAGISASERWDQLAQLADLHRKNIGERPTSLVVFEYDLNFGEAGDEPSAHLTRRATINAEELFSAQKHYVESKVTTRAEFEQFMQQIDDLVFARRDGDSLVLGGRKIQGHSYRGIRAEDVAAIWKSEDTIQSTTNPMEEKIEAFNRRWNSETYRTDTEKVALEKRYKREEAALKAELAKYKRDGSMAKGSGFSLDPTFDFDGLKVFFNRQLAPLLEFLPVTSIPADLEDDEKSQRVTINEVREALDHQDADPLFEMLGRIAELNPLMAKSIETEVKDRFSFQSARYDGHLKGTEVGMVLFYTDLLAKLWALDYLRSAPNYAVDDFKALTQVSVSPIYAKEIEQLSNTRLWFGPQDKGFQAADSGRSLLFAHIVTRVYAASSNSFQPGKEAEPNAASEAFLGWWDSHYEDIARYEPEYERLNQIMKWSLLIGWLNQEGYGKSLSFLRDVPIKNDNWFPQWAQQPEQARLRFRAWGATCPPSTGRRATQNAQSVCFFARGYKGAQTEGLPLLTSRPYKQFGQEMMLSGGVSLAEKATFAKRIPLSTSTETAPFLRRSNLKYGNLGDDGLATFDGASFKFKAVTENQSLLTASARSEAKLRGQFSELVHGTSVERTVQGTGAGLEIETKAAGAVLGDLRINPTPNGFRVGWKSRELDAGQMLVRQLSRSPHPEELLATHPDVVAALRLPGQDGYLVKLQNADSYLKMAQSRAPSVEIESGWQFRVASLEENVAHYNLAWMPEKNVATTLRGDTYLALSPQGRAPIRVVESYPPSGLKPYEVNHQGVTLRGQQNASTGEIYLRVDQLPANVRQDPAQLSRLLRPAEMKTELSVALREGNYEVALQNLLKTSSTEGAQFRQALGGKLTEYQQLLRGGRQADAHKLMQAMLLEYGRQPELIFYKSLTGISERSPKVGQTINEVLQSGVKNPVAFYQEVNARLARSGGSADSGRISLVPDGDKAVLRYELDALPPHTTVAPDALRGQNVRVYVQDAPGLNNLNWYVNPQRCLDEAVALKLGDLRRIPDADLANFRPSQLYVSDQSLVRTGQTGQASFRSYFTGQWNDPCQAPTSAASRNGECKPKTPPGEVYVLIAVAGTTTK